MIRSLLVVAALAALTVLAACQKEITCPAGELVCNGTCIDPAVDAANCGACGNACAGGASCRAGACVALSTDRLNCGAVGRACLPGESCLAGACTSLQVACFSVNEVRAVEPLDLAAGSAPRAAGVGPIALTTLGADVWAAASLSGSLSRLPFDLAAAPTEYLLKGNDFEYVATHAGRLLLSNAGAGTVVVVDPATGAAHRRGPGRHVGRREHQGDRLRHRRSGGELAFVSLYGDAVSGNPALGQKVAVLNAAGLATCGQAGGAAPTASSRSPTIDVSGGADAPGARLPRPIGHGFGGKVYVALANLKKGTSGYFTDPAGPGKLAVVNPADTSVSFFSLGAACGNPGGLAVHGTSLWVACGAGARPRRGGPLRRGAGAGRRPPGPVIVPRERGILR